MKAALWYARHDIRVEEVPEPEPPGPAEVVLKVEACGICGTDLEEYRAGPILIPVGRPNALTGRRAPIILGHEFAGEVVEVGSAVADLSPGDLITSDNTLYCGSCYWCLRHQVMLCEKLGFLGLSGDGGLAQYCKVPVSMCIKLPHSLSAEIAALAEPLSVSVRAVGKGRVALGDRVAVFGAGTIGLLLLQVAQSAGASAVYMVEPRPGRRELAMQMGATGVVDPTTSDPVEELRRHTGIGPDVVFEASGVASVVPVAVESVRKGGRVVLVGIPVSETSFNFWSVVATEKELIGSLAHIYDEDFATAVWLLGEGRVNVARLISDRIPLQDLVARGLQRLEQQPADTLKILVRPNG
jgi:(R,R)-butanediol dehydrogenase/meso-butanediol dehydrogenase/diacetyl reductase